MSLWEISQLSGTETIRFKKNLWVTVYIILMTGSGCDECVSLTAHTIMSISNFNSKITYLTCKAPQTLSSLEPL